MLQSRMIRYRRSLAYNNSNTMHINDLLLNGDLDEHKGLLLSIGYRRYTSYFEKLIRSPQISESVKSLMMDIYETLLPPVYHEDSKYLTIEERRRLGLEPNESISEEELNERLKADPYFTFYCKMSIIGKFKSIVITNIKKKYLLTPGKKYIFDLSDRSNMGHQLGFSKYKYMAGNIKGVSAIGTPGEEGACVVLDLSTSYDQYVIYIYDTVISNYVSANSDDTQTSTVTVNPLNYNRKGKTDAFDEFGYNYEYLVVDLTYDKLNTTMDLSQYQEPDIQCLTSSSDLLSNNVNGPKYLLEPAGTMTRRNRVTTTYRNSKQYGLYYGKYKFNFPFTNKENPFTIINKGKEDNIDISGNQMKIIHIDGLDEMGEEYNSFTLDGSYNFFYGSFEIDVKGDFGTCAMYSHKYGYNQMENLFVFTSECADDEAIPDEGEREYFDDQNTIELLFSHTRFGFDLCDNRPLLTFNNNSEDVSYVSGNTYGLNIGKYVISDIPDTNPLAFINHDCSNIFIYQGDQTKKKRRLGPDRNMYDFYYGAIEVTVSGDFEFMTLYDYYHGYSGGYNLFQYIGENYQDEDVRSIQYTDISGTFDIITIGDPYMDFSINNTADEVYLTSGASTKVGDYKYGFNIGNYVIMDVSKSYPMAFLNYGLEDRFDYDGYEEYEKQELGPDGHTYSFYYGNINLYVTGDFGQMSFMIYDGSAVKLDLSMNGKRKLIYDTSGAIGNAIPHNGKRNYDSQISYEDICGTFEIVDISASTTMPFYVDVCTNKIYLTSDYTIDDTTKYRLDDDVYTISDISSSYPMTFADLSFSGDSLIQAETPDGISYEFYYGNVAIDISGDFGLASFAILKEGGYITLDSSTIPFGVNPDTNNVYFTETELTNSSVKYKITDGSYVIQDVSSAYPIAFFNYGSYEGTFDYSGQYTISSFYSFCYGNISIKISGDYGVMSAAVLEDGGYITMDHSMNFGINTNNIYFTDQYIPIDSIKYKLTNGTYSISDVSSSYPIAFLNYGLEDVFSFSGDSSYEGMEAPDGNTYTFYHGNISIDICGNFGKMSFVTFNVIENTVEYMNGFQKLIYDSDLADPTIFSFIVGENKLIYDSSWADLATIDSMNGFEKFIYIKDLSLSNVGITIPFNSIANNTFEYIENVRMGAGVRNYYILVSVQTIVLPYSSNISSYYMSGYDRKGRIDSDEPNPSLSFSQGDTVFFNFHSNASNHRFGIYEYTIPLTDTQLIKNNLNYALEEIEWNPTIIDKTKYYYYRSSNYSDFMFNTIEILSADVSLSPVAPVIYNLSDGATISPDISYISMTVSSEIINVDTTKSFHFIRSNTSVGDDYGDFSFSGANIDISYDSDNNTSITFNMNFEFARNNENILEWGSSYTLLLDDGLLENIYEKSFDDLSLVTFSTIKEDPPILLSIEPSDNQVIEPGGTITLQFSKDVLNVYMDVGVTFTNVSGGSVVYYNDSTNFDVSNSSVTITLPTKEDIEIRSEIEYDSSYGLIIPAGAIVGTTFIDASFSSVLDNYTFRTETDPRPQLVSIDPANDSSGVGFIEIITLTFNEDISDDIAYSGIQFQINGETQVISNVDVSGQNVNITPGAVFEGDDIYRLIIPGNVFRDLSDNYYTGLFDYEITT